MIKRLKCPSTITDLEQQKLKLEKVKKRKKTSKIEHLLRNPFWGSEIKSEE